MTNYNLSEQIILEHNDGIKVVLSPIGASIVQISIPDDDGTYIPVTLSFKHRHDYQHNPYYFGATLGPSAGRIANGLLPLDNQTIQLDQNEQIHHLHGGTHNVSFQYWQILERIKAVNYSEITFCLSLPDQLDGYPGNRIIYVTYRLTDQNRLTIRYLAHSDLDTYFNLSTHTYFNLSGNDKKTGLAQLLFLDSATCYHNDHNHLPQVPISINNTPFDFRLMKSIQDNINSSPKSIQLLQEKGFNHTYVLEQRVTKNKIACPQAVLTNSEQTLQLHLSTDAPCLNFYSGGFILPTHQLDNDTLSFPSCGIALEPQDTPATYVITRANTEYKRMISYQFLRLQSSVWI